MANGIISNNYFPITSNILKHANNVSFYVLQIIYILTLKNKFKDKFEA